MSITDLPAEVLLQIGLTDPRAWKGLLVVRAFAGLSINKEINKIARKKFLIKERTWYDTVYRVGTLWHNEDDEPAHLCGKSISWYKLGKLHRDNGPAVVASNQDIELDRLYREKKKIPTEKVSLYWYKEGLLHRDDGPAVITKDKTSKWYKHGKIHRDDGPAVISLAKDRGDDPKKEIWYKDGEIHRDDGPAEVTRSWSKWYKHGQLHRDGDLPAVVSYDKLEWYKHGKLHRDGDKPAVISSSYRTWYKHGKRHRDNDMPAHMDDGGKIWYVDDKEMRGYLPPRIGSPRHEPRGC